MKPDTDPDVFLSKKKQIRVELSVLDEAAPNERLATITLDRLRAEIYSTVKLEAVRDLDLSLEQIEQMMITFFINQSEKKIVRKNIQESRKKQQSNRRGRENGQELAMGTAFIAYHYCKKPGHILRDCKTKLGSEVEMKKTGKIQY